MEVMLKIKKNQKIKNKVLKIRKMLTILKMMIIQKMKKKLWFLIVFVCCIGMHNLKAQYTEWGFSMTSGNSNVYGLDSDTNGNIYTTGHYYSGIVLGGSGRIS